jgi:hypothetical protein
MPDFKKSPYTKQELQRLADKDVYIIDGERYIKVSKQTDALGTTTFIYEPVENYLRGQAQPLPREAERLTRRQEPMGEALPPRSTTMPSDARAAEPPSKPIEHPYLKRKIAIIPFRSCTTIGREDLGTTLAGELADTMELRAYTALVVEWERVKRVMQQLGMREETPSDRTTWIRLHEATGIQGILMGDVYGPFTTTSRLPEGGQSSWAFIRFDVRLVDAVHGRTLKEVVSVTPLAESEEYGKLSKEKAQLRAVGLAIDQILQEVTLAIGRMAWFTTITAVDGEHVYLNAGYQTGLKKGDILDVYPPQAALTLPPKGTVRISRLFGMDASAAQVLRGSGFQQNDLVRPASQMSQVVTMRPARLN